MEMEPGKLFIGGISWDTSEDSLREYFETFGKVVEAVIMKDRTTGRARGFGFVVFANALIAEKVVRERHIIDGRTVEAKKAVPRDDHQNFNRNNNNNNNGSMQGFHGPTRTKKIFVGGLPSTIIETDFKRYFDQFGTITDVVVMYDHNTQRPRGFGFITYDSEEAVDKVLFKTFHELNGKMVEVKRALPKELSLGPTRAQLGAYNYAGLSRVSNMLNAYRQGYNNTMRMEGGQFSPASVGRSGYPPYSPSNYDMGLNLGTGLGLNFGPSGDSDLGFGRGMNSYYGRNTNRFGSPMGYDAAGNGPLLNTGNRNLWANGGLNHGSNSFIGSGAGNTGMDGSFGNIGEIWGSTPNVSSAQVGSGSGSLSNLYGIRENNFGGRSVYGGNNGGNSGTHSSYSIANNNIIRDGGFGSLYRGESFYGDHTWRSPSPELEGPTSFGYGGGAAADMALDNSVGYVGSYSVNARSSRGIAA